MLRFSANLSLLFTELELPDRITAAKAQGFDAMEIQYPYRQTTLALRQAIESAEVQLVLFNVPAGDLMEGGEGLSAVPRKQDEFRRAVDLALDYARVLKPLCVNVLPGRMMNEQRRGEYLSTLLENLHYAAEAFAPFGIKTVFEAVNTQDMPGFLIHRSEQMLEIVDTLNHPNPLMQYDIYHMCTMGEDPAAFIKSHTADLGHIQFADAPGRGQPGTGRVDFDTIFRIIEDSSYDGWLGAEYRPLGTTSASLEWHKKWRKTR
ncbi:MAG: TIM barrel protein [Pseudomonadota bacterium]